MHKLFLLIRTGSTPKWEKLLSLNLWTMSLLFTTDQNFSLRKNSRSHLYISHLSKLICWFSVKLTNFTACKHSFIFFSITCKMPPLKFHSDILTYICNKHPWHGVFVIYDTVNRLKSPTSTNHTQVWKQHTYKHNVICGNSTFWPVRLKLKQNNFSFWWPCDEQSQHQNILKSKWNGLGDYCTSYLLKLWHCCDMTTALPVCFVSQNNCETL